MNPSTEYYNRVADVLAPTYEALAFEVVHGDTLGFLPTQPCRVLDVGAGSGRDAAWFARGGHEVVAVEPATRMRHWAKVRHSSARICWLADGLPGLSKVGQMGLRFELVWLSAVWMHVPPGQRHGAFGNLVASLAGGGRLIVTLRHGPAPPERAMYPVSAAELQELAGLFRLQMVAITQSDDQLGRTAVGWESVVLQLPDTDEKATPPSRQAQEATYPKANRPLTKRLGR